MRYEIRELLPKKLIKRVITNYRNGRKHMINTTLVKKSNN